MTCPNCKKKCLTLKTIIRHNKLLEGCEYCLNQLIQGTETEAANHRRADYRQHAKDMVQVSEGRDWVKAYGVDNARQTYGDDMARKYA